MKKMRKSRNILYDDERKIRNRKILLITMSIILLCVIAVTAYLITSRIDNNKPQEETVKIDDRFIKLTLKSIIDFEKPTKNYLNYQDNSVALGYFYKNQKLTNDKLSKDIIIASTINRMFECTFINGQLPACEISRSQNKDYEFQVLQRDVLRYAKLLYGENITYKNQSLDITYGNVEKIYAEKNLYYFNSKNQFGINDEVKSYYDYVNTVSQDNNQAIVNKSVVYIEEIVNNRVISGVKIYRYDDKKELLKTIDAKINNYKTMYESVDNYLKSNESPKYKLIYQKNEDGTFYFLSSEPLN